MGYRPPDGYVMILQAVTQSSVLPRRNVDFMTTTSISADHSVERTSDSSDDAAIGPTESLWISCAKLRACSQLVLLSTVQGSVANERHNLEVAKDKRLLLPCSR